jgi:hypothetical protein
MSELRGTVGGIYAVTGEFALSLYGVYRSMYGLNVLEYDASGYVLEGKKADSDATAIVVSVFYNITPNMDITLDGIFNNFSGPRRSERPFTSSEEVYAFTLAWRR